MADRGELLRAVELSAEQLGGSIAARHRNGDHRQIEIRVRPIDFGRHPLAAEEFDLEDTLVDHVIGGEHSVSANDHTGAVARTVLDDDRRVPHLVRG